MILRNKEILIEISDLIGNKIKRFYLRYWRELNADIYMMVSLIHEIIESIPEFEIETDTYKKNHDRFQQRMFNELKSSQEFGIGKSLARIQKKYNLSLEEMIDYTAAVVLLSYQCESFPMMDFKRGALN